MKKIKLLATILAGTILLTGCSKIIKSQVYQQGLKAISINLDTEDGKYDFNDSDNTKYGIEPITDFRNRINEFLDDITKKYVGKNVLVVTHAGVGIYIRCYFEGEPKDGNYSSYKINNCEFLMYENNK